MPVAPSSAPPADNWPALVIFDCDGVLVDSELIALACTRSAFRDLGIELSATEVSDLFLGMSAQSMPAIAERALGVTAARRAGMVVFGFVGGAHAKGEDYRRRLQGAGAELIFADMRELPAHVAARRAARG